MATGIQRNIALYPVYRIAADAYAWIPIFFLYFSERLSVSDVLLLEAIFYIAVVTIEVPSGYFSDVLGRRRTLFVSAIAVFVSYLFLLSSNTFVGFACGQILMALGNAFRSGTDTSLHYESLVAAGREVEYGDREAKAGQYGFLATALAALAGGILGSYDLSWPYWFSLATAGASIFVVSMFVEPDAPQAPPGSTGFVNQIAGCLKYMKLPLLGWLFVYYIYMYTIVHVPFEFYQPYLALLSEGDQLAGYSAPLVAGIIFAITAFVGSFAARFSMTLRRSLGLVSLLTWAALLEIVVIAALAFWLHPLLAALVILRNGPMAVINAPINATIAPQIADQHRATYLSLRSLAARLVFAGMLAGFAALMSDNGAIEWQPLSLVLRVALGIAVAGIIVLLLAAWRLAQASGQSDDFYS